MNKDYSKTTWSARGWEYIKDSISENSGAILLMSHIGNWDSAANILAKEGCKLMLLMGIREHEQMEALYKEKLREQGIEVLGISQDSMSTSSIVDAVNHIKDGGIVALTGDKLWSENQKRVEISFFNGKAYLPEFPFMLSMLSKAPLLIFTSISTGETSYFFTCEEPIVLDVKDRKMRKSAIKHAAQMYGDVLQKTVINYPHQWFHFDKFIH